MSNFELDWGQPPVGEDVYFSDPSIGGSGLMQSASRVRGTSHRGYGTRSRALTRGCVTSMPKKTTQPTESCSPAGVGPRR